jgi:hypothetical protein
VLILEHAGPPRPVSSLHVSLGLVIIAGMTVLSAGVLLIGAGVSRLERRLLRWKPSSVTRGRAD